MKDKRTYKEIGAMLWNMRLATKLIFSFGSVTFIIVCLGMFGYFGMEKDGEALANIGNNLVPSEESSFEINRQANKINTAMHILATPDLKDSVYMRQYNIIGAARKEGKVAWKKYVSLPRTPEEEGVWQQFLPVWKKWEESNNATLGILRRIETLDSSNPAQAEQITALRKKAHQQILDEVEGYLEKASGLLGKISDLNSSAVDQTVQFAEHKAGLLDVIGLCAALFGAFLSLVMAIVIIRAIKRPLAKGVSTLNEISRGNLAVDIQIDSKDEIGEMLTAMKDMTENLRRMFSDITEGVATLSSSSTELSAISSQLSSNAEDTSNRSATVASATEELSTNMSSVSAAMEQSSSNVGMVATATEEMSSTVNEIAHNSAKAKNITEDAVYQSQKTSLKIKELSNAADKIGKVTEVITEISEQTNLLALNATIEAARAGEAGKGFAVVANEIKELAKQTAEATIDIRNQIGNMQQTTSGTIVDIEHIAKVINEINEVITTIATAVEQQSAATSEISENISQAAAGITEVNENVAQGSIAIGDITKDIGGISGSSEEVSQGSHNVKESATEMSQLAEQLAGLVKHFKV